VEQSRYVLPSPSSSRLPSPLHSDGTTRRTQDILSLALVSFQDEAFILHSFNQNSSNMNSSHITFPPQPQLLERGGVSKPKKLRRISRACDFCHNRSIRCQPSKVEGDASKCQNCIDFAVRCTYDRPAKKRGVKSGRSSENGGSRDGESDARMLLELTNGTKSSIPGVWKGEMEGYGKEITDLVEVYFEIVYPM
jgi:hypothetical protein